MSDPGKTDRVEGKFEEIGGSIKKGIGRLLGDEHMEADGKAKEAKGLAHQDAAKAGERAKGKVEELAGSVKNRVGHLIDNEQMQLEGKLKELAGVARQKANK